MDNCPKKYHVLISGGGTGGHIFPALSIADALTRRDPETEILFVGAKNRMEMERIPQAGYKIVGLPVYGFERKKIWRNLKVLCKLFESILLARKILRDFRPDIAIGVGGYASGPMLKAAQRQKVPTLLQEQNSYAGITNKLLAKNSNAICVAYEGMERFFPSEKIIITGNPVRKDILHPSMTKQQAKVSLGFDASRPLVLVIGGSLGARTINESIASALSDIENSGASVLWQTGKIYARECLGLAKGHRFVKALPFITEMSMAYKAADIVVSRAGAGTISELQLLGLPAILVPSPNVAEDHQRKNAQALADKNAAVMILDADCRGALGESIISLLQDNDKMLSLAKNISAMALPDADEKIVAAIYDILKPAQ